MQELGLGAEIGAGRTARVFEGCINGEPVAVKVCSSAHTYYLGDQFNDCSFCKQAAVRKASAVDQSCWATHAFVVVEAVQDSSEIALLITSEMSLKRAGTRS